MQTHVYLIAVPARFRYARLVAGAACRWLTRLPGLLIWIPLLPLHRIAWIAAFCRLVVALTPLPARAMLLQPGYLCTPRIYCADCVYLPQLDFDFVYPDALHVTHTQLRGRAVHGSVTTTFPDFAAVPACRGYGLDYAHTPAHYRGYRAVPRYLRCWVPVGLRSCYWLPFIRFISLVLHTFTPRITHTFTRGLLPQLDWTVRTRSCHTVGLLPQLTPHTFAARLQTTFITHTGLRYAFTTFAEHFICGCRIRFVTGYAVPVYVYYFTHWLRLRSYVPVPAPVARFRTRCGAGTRPFATPAV